MARKHDVAYGHGSIEERTTKAGATRFVARWNDGEKWRGKTFASIEEAEDHLRTIGRAKRGGRYTPDTDLMVTELVAEYIERGRKRWTSNTTGGYLRILRTEITPAFGRRRVRDVTPRMAQTVVDNMSRKFQPRRVEQIRALLSGAFKEAVRLGVIDQNPIQHARGPKIPRSEKPAWTSDEAAKVLAYVEDDPALHAWYLVALSTGMRPGELRALRWSDIDMTARTLTVARTASRDERGLHIIGETTKTGRARTIAVSDAVIAALQRYRPVYAARRLKAAHWRDLDLVWPRGDGNVVAQPTLARRHLNVCTGAGVTIITPHGTRHTAATLMVEAGVNIKAIADRLGHERIATTLEIYARVTEGMQRSAADTMDDVLRKRA